MIGWSCGLLFLSCSKHINDFFKYLFIFTFASTSHLYNFNKCSVASLEQQINFQKKLRVGSIEIVPIVFHLLFVAPTHCLRGLLLLLKKAKMSDYSAPVKLSESIPCLSIRMLNQGHCGNMSSMVLS